MSHGVSGDDDGSLSDINVTPLVDVVLVLLIVFMITVPAMVASAPIKVELPETTSVSGSDSPPTDLLPQEIFVKRDPSGGVAIFVGDVSYTEETIVEVIPLLLQASEVEPVKLSADKGLIYDEVVHVMDVLYSHGLRKLGLATKPVARREP